MKMARLNLLLAMLVSSTSAWTVLPTRRTVSARRTARLYADQWDDEEELPSVTTYDDAAKGLLQQKEDKELEEFGQSDQAVPGSETDAQEKLRNAVRLRTSNLGMDEASTDALQEAEKRAAKRTGTGSFGGLDLSQISDGGYEKLSINYEPEDEMSEDEMRTADPLGFQPWAEQYSFELKESTFPDAVATLSKVALLIVLGLTTGFLIITTDKLVRNFYVDSGLLPSPADVARAQSSGMEMAKELTKTTVAPGNLPDLAP